MNASAAKPDRSRRRRRVLTASLIMLVVFAGAGFNAFAGHEGPWRAVDLTRIFGLIALALVLALRSTTSFSLVGRNPELDDELTRANRGSAAVFGFWGALLAAVALLIASLAGPLSASEAAPYVVVIGAIAAGARFVMLEARGE